jgi:nucleoside-diphosphate-sugar epimerase
VTPQRKKLRGLAIGVGTRRLVRRLPIRFSTAPRFAAVGAAEAELSRYRFTPKVVRAASEERVVVTGAGGFIGGHLVAGLITDGYRVRAVDQRPVDEWHQVFPDAENLVLDLRGAEPCRRAAAGAAIVYNLAADMGGMGFIAANKARCMLTVLINTHLLQAAVEAGVERYFFSSSACVYAQVKQLTPRVEGLKESDAYPADPEDGYGWEKLFSERMCRHFAEDFGLPTRVARYHNVYGPHGTWFGGREKAPAAICRKVAEAKLSGRHEIEVWGDGEQTRSFMYIEDCVEGTRRIMASDIYEPINLGSCEIVTINTLIDIVEEIAGIKVTRRYNLDAPEGVRGRNSDNTLIRERLGWEPAIPLQDGLERTYRWIFDQVAALERVG